MTPKEYLSQAFFIDRKIKAKERQLESLKAHALYTTPQFGEKTPHSPSVVSAMEESAVRIIELLSMTNMSMTASTFLTEKSSLSVRAMRGTMI